MVNVHPRVLALAAEVQSLQARAGAGDAAIANLEAAERVAAQLERFKARALAVG